MIDAKLLTVEQAADELQISKDALYAHITGGVMPVVNVGTERRPRFRITRADLDDFISGRRSFVGGAA